MGKRTYKTSEAFYKAFSKNLSEYYADKNAWNTLAPTIKVLFDKSAVFVPALQEARRINMQTLYEWASYNGFMWYYNDSKPHGFIFFNIGADVDFMEGKSVCK